MNLLTEHEESIIQVDMDQNEWSKFVLFRSTNLFRNIFGIFLLHHSTFKDAVRRGMQPDPRRTLEEGGSSLGLGELAQLTVNNDAEAAYDVSRTFPRSRRYIFS